MFGKNVLVFLKTKLEHHFPSRRRKQSKSPIQKELFRVLYLCRFWATSWIQHRLYFQYSKEGVCVRQPCFLPLQNFFQWYIVSIWRPLWRHFDAAIYVWHDIYIRRSDSLGVRTVEGMKKNSCRNLILSINSEADNCGSVVCYIYNDWNVDSFIS